MTVIERTANGDFVVPRVETISEEQIKNLLSAAFEGGINYWVSEVLIVDKDGNEVDSRPEQADYYYESVLYGCDLKMRDRVEEDELGNEDVWHTLTIDNLIKALPKVASHYGKSVLNFAEDHDAESTDVWVQFATLGEIIYG